MEKPIKKYPYEPVFDWTEVEEYINEKYQRELRDWDNYFLNGKVDDKKKYQDFWHYICDESNPNNGSVFWILPIVENLEPWQLEILNILRDECFLDEKYEGKFYVDW